MALHTKYDSLWVWFFSFGFSLWINCLISSVDAIHLIKRVLIATIQKISTILETNLIDFKRIYIYISHYELRLIMPVAKYKLKTQSISEKITTNFWQKKKHRNIFLNTEKAKSNKTIQ